MAIKLRNNGIDAILDQFELQPGDDLPHFMETQLASSDNIIMICTENYVNKANNGEGGVGYEKMIITANLLKKINENKIIPVIKQSGSTKIPTFLKTKLYINFSKTDDIEFSYDELVRTIHKSPLFKKPPIGNNPFKPVEREKLDGDIEFLHILLKQIMVEYDEHNHPYTEFIARHLNVNRAFVDIGIEKLIKLGLVEWYIKNSMVTLTDKGKFYLMDNGLISRTRKT